jgi:hypothetical protein
MGSRIQISSIHIKTVWVEATSPFPHTAPQKETWVPGENHWPVTSHWQTLFHNVYQIHLPWVGFKLTTLVVKDIDCKGRCKSNYHTITTTTALQKVMNESKKWKKSVNFYHLWNILEKKISEILPSINRGTCWS